MTLAVVCAICPARADKPALALAEKPPPGPRPLRVLLLTDLNAREFQFTRLALLPERKSGCELHHFSQQPRRAGITADVPPDWLERFPTDLKPIDPTKPPRGRLSNLARFDVLVAFDADWRKFDARTLNLLRRWVGDHGGGLIFVAGALNTPALAASRGKGPDRAKLQPIRDLLPVVLGDELKHPAESPRRLNFTRPAREVAFLRLDPKQASVPLSGWEAFFRGQPGEANGFYSLYPVSRVKKGATVLATFADRKLRTDEGAEQPCVVSATRGKGRVVYLGCSDFWRLRQVREEYHVRFWTGLMQYGERHPTSPNP
jgi:hypothetical protein